MRRGDLDDLAAFATVARVRSFTRAAAELGLSPSALSHAMKALETRLGVRLLARTTRSVAPTAAGELLLRSVDPALTQVAAALAALADWRDAPSGTIRLTTFGYAARTILAPRLPDFLRDHPDIAVEVIVEDRLIDLIAGGFDAGIRLGETVQRDMVAVPVGPSLRTVVVGTPGYFAQHGMPRTPDDLADHVCINYRLLGGGGLLPWEFCIDGRDVRMRVSGQLIVNDEVLAGAAMRAGAGLGYVMEHDVADEIADGRLVQVLSDHCTPYPGCHLYYPDRRVSPALRVLIDRLRWRDQASPNISC
ncbi:LysR family transcriptional regulator [Sphingomonas pseudosanguinis]|uniref:DNA-binding transcriptional LysR family regulator n=1 Tax=Sphingomonas pseudosanguinis TaxID=413712 RepID=A0A7W6F3G1_9SPHN|nr:LysR family transcriptional regulator [Sphingomonas pseudosanguinis]MBB3879763.1 DNA-binding transcriptional LysR family regulator [Sphingomonas pseudosanguinis]MBN3536947.1 LysR family transcriptional regulator [Sphingomonas pseudosanguinis]